jgi:hypothetical protein
MEAKFQISKLMLCSIMLSMSVGSSLAKGPFSRAPFGQKIWSGTAADAGRGGAGLAEQDSTRLNMRNPANFHSGRQTRIQIGFEGSRVNLESSTESQTINSGAFSHWLLGFPLTTYNIDLGIGLRPKTFTDFNFAVSGVDDQENEFIESLRGSGGLSVAHFTVAHSLKNFPVKVGLEVGLQFGSVIEEYRMSFTDRTSDLFNNQMNRRLSIFGFNPRLGLSWAATSNLDLALVYEPSMSNKIKIDLDNLATGESNTEDKGALDFPSVIEFGLLYRYKDFNLWMDLSQSDWSSIDASVLGLGDAVMRESTLDYAFGLEYRNDADFFAPWYRKPIWRTGLRLQEHYANHLNDGVYHELEMMTFTLGAGIPLKTRGTWLDLAVDYSLSGDIDTHGLSDKTITIKAGLSARDLWFWRPTY